MSASIGASGIAGYGLANTLVANAADTRRRLDTLSQQAASGLIGGTYAGLGAGARVALDLGPSIAHTQTWKANIDGAAGRMQVTQTAMAQLQSIASGFNAQMNNLNGLNAAAIDSVAANARSALQQVAGLLDTQNAGTYVFAGADTANPPVPDPDSILTSGFYTQINAAVAGLGGFGAAATIATMMAVATSNTAGTSPFSASQSQPATSLVSQIPAIDVGPASRVAVGLLASANAAAVSTGASTTGSYARDLMRALATIGSLSSTQVSLPGFAGLVADTRSSLTGAISAMAADAGILGDKQASLASTRTLLTDTATALTAQVSAVQDVDMAATLSALQQVQIKLQASYRMIADLPSLSLAKYLSGG